ncbi:hypothetical protein [Streptomyces sp. Amel2xC10]|uniref:hypothetical protein n=1 Tax=Streptomyces sp. Amel2xC10 TaxID=1305826 RepID=UPI000A085BC8|nr:hypothetical protein [Streptomyces sp. Amel2xC10]SMF85914.1 hypothetical protein SAMN02745830_07084 [Streptomyces sp. Amel2xC10]
MPLEENGLITSYRVGRPRYEGLRQLLPLKLELNGHRLIFEVSKPRRRSAR